MRLLVIMVWVTICFSGAVSAASWVKYYTPHFEVYSQASDKRTRSFIEDLEVFRYFLLRANGFAEAEGEVPLKLYITDRMRDYEQLTGSMTTAGLYKNDRSGPVAISIGQKRRWRFASDPQQVMIHEYVHYLMAQYSGRWFPKWYSEGFADYLSSFTYENRTLTLGTQVMNRIPVLNRNRNWAHLEEVMSAKITRVKHKDARESSGLFYSQSWYLTHYLNHHPEYKSKLQDLLRAQADGLSARDAVKQALGITIDQLDQQLKELWKTRSLSLAYAKIDASFNYDLQTRKLSKSEGRLIDAEIIGLFNRTKKGEERLLKALKKDKNSIPLKEVVANYYARRKMWDEALDVLGDVDKSSPLELRKIHALMLLYKNTKNMSVMADLPVMKLKAIRVVLSKHINRNVDDVEARFAYSFSFMTRAYLSYLKQEKKDIVLANIRLAHELAPQRSDIGFWYAVFLKEFGKQAEACRVIRSVINKLDLTPREVNDYKRSLDLPTDQPISCSA